VQHVENPDIRAGQVGDALWVVELVGEHDLATAPQLQGALDEIEVHGTAVIVDLTEASFIDSTILGVIVGFAEKPREHVGLVVPPGTVPRRVIDIIGMQSRLAVYDSRTEATAALQP
jgi:anti-sigma B factor antagonist